MIRRSETIPACLFAWILLTAACGGPARSREPRARLFEVENRAALLASAPALPSSELIQDFGSPPRQANVFLNVAGAEAQGGAQTQAPAARGEAASSLPARSPRTEPPLRLADVVESVNTRYPPMLAALLEEDIASGRLLTAQGGFDLNFLARTTLETLGYYSFTDTNVILEQPLALGGLSLLGGYKLGTGSPPLYLSEKRTNDGGEFNAGFRLPLLQGNSIDRRRVNLSQAEIDKALADPIIFRQRLDFLRIAGRAYWSWFAAGKRLEIAEDLLRIALDRDALIARRVELGDLPPIDRVDNERLVVQRRSFVIASERRFQQAAIELSLYYRDEYGRPVVAKRERVPDEFPGYVEPLESTLAADVADAYRQRPEVKQLLLLTDRADVDLAFAENQTLPNLDVTVIGTAPLNDSPYFDKSEFNIKAAVEFKSPVQRREAFGRVDSTKAQIDRLTYEARFVKERIDAEILDAISAKTAAFKQIAEFKRNTELATQLQRAEQRAFDLGRSNLIFVNLREQQRADAAALEVDALAEYFRAQVDYAVAIGSQDVGRGIEP